MDFAKREISNRQMKKKTFALVALVLMLAAFVASCTHHTCPAYRGSVVMAEAVE